MPHKKTPGPAVERSLTADINARYPALVGVRRDVTFSKIGPPCEGIITFCIPGENARVASFIYYPTKAEHRLDVYNDWGDAEQ